MMIFMPRSGIWT